MYFCKLPHTRPKRFLGVSISIESQGNKAFITPILKKYPLSF
jgi:hypothetical protein